MIEKKPKAQQLIKVLVGMKNTNKKEIFSRFFKTAKGEYGEGDLFLGLSVPVVRKNALFFKNLPEKEVQKLLDNKYHECRLAGLMILVFQYKKSDKNNKKKIINFYLKNSRKINNWDLVDLSCYQIVGDFLIDKNRNILYKMAKSKNLWERRISIVSTYAFLKNKDNKDTFKITEILMSDREDLIHKACGWMLRESGKKVSEEDLLKFLEKNISKMPRTMLRYAIEKFEENRRQYFLKK